jgi:hypothetical protein
MADLELRDDGSLTLELEEHESTILEQLLDEMHLLVEGTIDRSDPAVDRLFPTAYQDPDDEESYRDLVEDTLRKAKLDAIEAAKEDLRTAPDITLPREEVDRWLALLTDLRLAIAARLEIDEEKMSSEIDPGDREAVPLSVLHWLGWVQGTMLEKIMSQGEVTDAADG